MLRKANLPASDRLPQYAPPGAVVADALYTLPEAAARLGWGAHAVRAARRRGLKVHRCGRRNYVLGSDLLAFVTGSPSTSRVTKPRPR
jgi:hypothetical protein